jgi:large subunit ribosomal protein L25
MEVAKIRASVRREKGKRAVARLRADGRVPGVIYGLGSDNQSFTVDLLDLLAHLRHHHRVYQVDLGSGEQAAYLQDVQYDCLTDEPLHVDFKRIDLDQPIDLVVEVHFIGHPVGLGKGGMLVRDRMQVEITAKPTAIPENLPVKIDHLEIGSKLVASEITLPEGVTLKIPPEATICHVIEAKIAEAPAAPAAAEPAAGDAAKAGEAKADDKGDDKDKKAEDKKEDKKR